MPVRSLSFVGHSAGNLAIRQMLLLPPLQPLLARLHTYISLSGPHLGMCPAPALMRVGIAALHAVGKGATLRQLSLCDASDPRDGLLYRLAAQSHALGCFQNLVLMSSEQDGCVFPSQQPS